jgi:hypothetical protein
MEASVTREELLSDLAYARTLAEEGRQAPLIGGAFLVLFGVLLAIAYAVHWALLTGQIPMLFAGWNWLAFGVCAFAGSMLLRGRVKQMPGASAIGNRAERTVWRGVSIAILVVVIGAIVQASLTGQVGVTNAIMAAGFGLYGVALYATAVIGGHRWLAPFAYLAWLISGVLWAFMNEPWAYLLAAAGSVLVLLIPGIISMRGEPSKVV